MALLGLVGVVEACSSDTIVEETAQDPTFIPDSGAGDASGPRIEAGSDAADAALGPSSETLRASESVVDFGAIDCGTSAAAKSLRLTNRSTRAIEWSATLQRGAPFSLQGTRSGRLEAGASATLTLAFDAPTGIRSGTGITDAIVIDDGDDTTRDPQVTVRAELAGADLTLTSSALSFGSVDVSGPPSTRPVPLENRGNRPATVSFDPLASGPFTLVMGAAGATTTVLAPGASASGIGARFAPDTDGPASASFVLVASGSVCTTPAVPLELTGTGVSSDLRVSELELDWGLVNCGSSGAPKTLTLTNAGTASVGYTLALAKGAGSSFALSRTSGTLAINASQAITVTPKAIPAGASAAVDTSSNAFGDVLRITEAGGNVRTVSLLLGAKGAVFQTLPASVTFPSTVLGSTRDFSVNLINVGSGRARVQYALTPSSAPFRSSRALGPVPVEGQNDSLVDAITFEPTQAGTFNATLTWSFVAAPARCCARRCRRPSRFLGRQRADRSPRAAPATGPRSSRPQGLTVNLLRTRIRRSGSLKIHGVFLARPP